MGSIKARFFRRNEDTDYKIGNPNGDYIDYIPRIGEEVKLHDGYNSKDDICGRVIDITYERFNINEKTTIIITLQG